jgi:AhpD family alkylhydroperoxidase
MAITFIRNVLATANPLGRKRRRQAAAKAAASPLGGFRKRTMTAKEFVCGTSSLVAQTPTLYKVWVKHELDPGFREELMLAVAKLNDCRYCSWGHHEWAHIAGIPEEELAHIEQMDPTDFDRRKWLAISYVRALVEARFGAVAADLQKEMRAHYTEREVREITLVAKVMDISNRGANTWDSLLARLQGRPAAQSRLVDEAVLSVAFLAVAPVILVFLARASKRPIMDMARSFVDYAKRMEQAPARTPSAPPAKARDPKKQAIRS